MKSADLQDAPEDLPVYGGCGLPPLRLDTREDRSLNDLAVAVAAHQPHTKPRPVSSWTFSHPGIRGCISLVLVVTSLWMFHQSLDLPVRTYSAAMSSAAGHPNTIGWDYMTGSYWFSGCSTLLLCATTATLILLIETTGNRALRPFMWPCRALLLVVIALALLLRGLDQLAVTFAWAGYDSGRGADFWLGSMAVMLVAALAGGWRRSPEHVPFSQEVRGFEVVNQ